MTDHELRQSLAALPVPPISAQARDRALHRATIALANPEPDTPARRSSWHLALATLGSTCAFLLCAWLLHPSAAPATAAADRELLAETGQLFPGQLNAIIINDGTPRLDLADIPASLPAPEDQAVLVELTRNGHTLRVLSYSGRTIRVQLDGTDLHLIPLLTATGDILLTGDDFVWSKDAPTKIAGWSVNTQPLAASL